MQEQYYRQNKETFHGDDAKALFLRVVGKYFPTPCGRSGETTAVIDVGANTGQDVKYFSKWFGAGQSCRSKIYLFEPNPQVCLHDKNGYSRAWNPVHMVLRPRSRRLWTKCGCGGPKCESREQDWLTECFSPIRPIFFPLH